MKLKNSKKVVIIGAGPGGLAAGMILTNRGFEVEIFERKNQIGGRNASVKIEGYTFDVGPTFIMLPQVFKDVFAQAGRDYEKELDIIELDVLYRLRYADGKDFFVYHDKNKLKKEFERLFPGEWLGYEKWYAFHRKKYERVMDALRIPYLSCFSYFNPLFLKALPYIQAHRSVMSVLNDYFKSEDLKMAMAFQAKYLGMSPLVCPGTFTILPFFEHEFGLTHYRGGVSQLSKVMARICRENGVKIHLSTEVKRIIVENGKAKGIEIGEGKKIFADEIIMNADFAEGMQKMVSEKDRPSYTNEKIKKKQFSCSTFMLYLGVKKKYDIPHHNIFFGGDYEKNFAEITKEKVLPRNPAFYLQNASVSDETLAPKGKSTIYVLVPVPDANAEIDWETEKKRYRNFIIKEIETRTEMKDISQHIEVEKVITPADWRDDLKIYRGAVFSLAHNVKQMLYLRPHNRFDDIENLYLVGGGTHPGSGLPTIIESSRIAADLISKKL